MFEFTASYNYCYIVVQGCQILQSHVYQLFSKIHQNIYNMQKKGTNTKSIIILLRIILNKNIVYQMQNKYARLFESFQMATLFQYLCFGI